MDIIDTSELIVQNLIAQIEAALTNATPGEWEWWTSNSFLRLSSRANGKDGGVINSYVMRDGHPTLRVTEADKSYIVAVNPAVMAQVVAYVRELESIKFNNKILSQECKR